jgi:hypothetical protein
MRHCDPVERPAVRLPAARPDPPRSAPRAFPAAVTAADRGDPEEGTLMTEPARDEGWRGAVERLAAAMNTLM